MLPCHASWVDHRGTAAAQGVPPLLSGGRARCFQILPEPGVYISRTLAGYKQLLFLLFILLLKIFATCPTHSLSSSFCLISHLRVSEENENKS